jgi:hypothetical protein
VGVPHPPSPDTSPASTRAPSSPDAASESSLLASSSPPSTIGSLASTPLETPLLEEVDEDPLHALAPLDPLALEDRAASLPSPDMVDAVLEQATTKPPAKTTDTHAFGMVLMTSSARRTQYCVVMSTWLVGLVSTQMSLYSS